MASYKTMLARIKSSLLTSVLCLQGFGRLFTSVHFRGSFSVGMGLAFCLVAAKKGSWEQSGRVQVLFERTRDPGLKAFIRESSADQRAGC